jgi:hypothetical protein
MDGERPIGLRMGGPPLLDRARVVALRQTSCGICAESLGTQASSRRRFRTRKLTMHIHPDSESLEFHMQVAAQRIGKGIQIVETKRLHLYGKPSDRLLEQFQRMAVSWPVIVKTHIRGFTRSQTG